MEPSIIKKIIEILSRRSGKKDQHEVDQYLAEAFEKNKWSDEYGDPEEVKSEISNVVTNNINPQTRVNRKVYSMLWKAAAALILVGFVGYYISKVDRISRSIPVRLLTFSSKTPGLSTSEGDFKQISEMKIGQIYETSLFSIERLSQRQFRYLSKVNIGSKTLIRFATDANESYQIELADKSKITLDSNSELIFPSEFSGNSRELGASGKLFFDVAKDKARPFSVSSETITALVKGTSFVFRADGSKENSFVALIEGSLEMKTPNSQILLKPGQKGLIKKNRLSVDKFNLDEMIAFERNEFFFENQPISYIMNEIARWYKMDLELISFDKDPHTLTVKINRSKPLNEVLDILESTGSLNISMEERRIIVRKVEK